MEIHYQVHWNGTLPYYLKHLIQPLVGGDFLMKINEEAWWWIHLVEKRYLWLPSSSFLELVWLATLSQVFLRRAVDQTFLTTRIPTPLYFYTGSLITVFQNPTCFNSTRKKKRKYMTRNNRSRNLYGYNCATKWSLPPQGSEKSQFVLKFWRMQSQEHTGEKCEPILAVKHFFMSDSWF